MSTTEAAPGEMLEAALSYAKRGFPVFPARGKIPLTKNGFKDASRDANTLTGWWRQYPDANVAMPTGLATATVVLDADIRTGGIATLLAFEETHGRLPKTPRSLTGTGGWHIFLRHPGPMIGNSSGKLGPGLDVRGDGGYVVVPPSRHPETGNPYKWLRPFDQVPAKMPSWLLHTLTATTGTAPTVGERIGEGSRDSTLTSLAGTMRRRGMDEAAILAALLVTNERCDPPLDKASLQRIARSVSRYQPEPRDPEPDPIDLAVMTARDLCALPEPETGDELLGPLVVRGQRLVLGAHTGEGKTTLTLQLLRAIVLGEPFLEWEGVGTEARVLVIDAEQGLRTVKRRLTEAGLADSIAVDYVRVPDGLELDSNAAHVEAVERVIGAGYDVVVADPLYKLHTGDSNAEREAVDLMRRFDAWREQYGFAFLVPTHCRKPVPGTRFTIHDLFGSSAYTRGAEVVLGLQRVGNGAARLHFLKDRDGDLPIGTAWRLLFDREHGFRRDPSDGEPSTQEKLLELRSTEPEITQKAAAERLGVTERTIRTWWAKAQPWDEETLLDGGDSDE